MNNETWEIVHSLSDGGFCETNYEYNWELFEYLAHDTRQWELNNQQNSSFVRPYENFDTKDSSSMFAEDLVRSLAISVGDLATNVTNLTTIISQQQSTILKVEIQLSQMTSAIMKLEAQNEFDCYDDESQNECESKFENPPPNTLNVNHSFDFYDEDDEDMFDSEEYGSDLSCLPTSRFDCSLIDHSLCANIATSHIDENLLKDSELSDNLSIKVVFSVKVGEKQEKERVEEKDFDMRKFEQIEEYSLKNTPPLFHLGDSHVLVTNASYTFLFAYPIFTKPEPSFKETYRDVEFLFEHSGPNNCLLYACAFIVHVWFHLVIIHYYHFSSLYASIFDRLLRALSCSALDLSWC